MRVLHLIDTLHSMPCPTLLAQAADAVRSNTLDEQAVWTIGSSEITPAANSGGLRVQRHIPCGAGAWHQWWVRRRMPAIDAQVIHLWTIGAAAFAPPGTPLTAGFHHLPQGLHLKSSARAALLGAKALGVFNEADSQRLASVGIDAARIQLLDPGLDLRRLAATDRAAVRTRLGIKDESLQLAAVIGDPSGDIDGLIGATGVGIANETGRHVRLIISPRAGAVNRAIHMLTSAKRRTTLIDDALAEEPWRILGACDLAVVMAGAHSAAWAMAAGLPLVAADRPELRRLLKEGKTARFGRADSCAQIAQAVCRTLDQPDQSRAMAQAAKAEAERRFPAAGWITRMRGHWESRGAIT